MGKGRQIGGAAYALEVSSPVTVIVGDLPASTVFGVLGVSESGGGRQLCDDHETRGRIRAQCRGWTNPRRAAKPSDSSVEIVMLWKVALGVGAAFVLVVAGVVIGIRLALPPIDLNSSDPWVRVKVFSGDLNPQDRDVTVTVSVVSHRSDGLDQRDAFRTKIEIASAGGVRTFLWSQDYAGSWCEIVDLDRDGYGSCTGRFPRPRGGRSASLSRR